MSRRNPGHLTSAQHLNASDALAAPVNTSDSNTDHSSGTKAIPMGNLKKNQSVETLIIGASIIERFQGCVNDQKLEVLCLPGTKIQNISKYIYAQQMLPQTVISDS